MTYISSRCGRCSDNERFNDRGWSVCATCGLTRHLTARDVHPSSGPDLSVDTPPRVSASGPDRAGAETRPCPRSVDSAPAHTRIGTFGDGSQILVTEHSDGSAEVATRPDRWAVWGPPVKLEDAP